MIAIIIDSVNNVGKSVLSPSQTQTPFSVWPNTGCSACHTPVWFGLCISVWFVSL
jgi:hypothetical protein